MQKLEEEALWDGLDVTTPLNVQQPNQSMLTSSPHRAGSAPLLVWGAPNAVMGVTREISPEGITAPKVPSDPGLVLLTYVC